MPHASPAQAAVALDDWRGRLREVVLPALGDEAAWQALLHNADDPELTATAVAGDPPLGLSLLVEGNRSPRIAANLSGLQHVLRMFGSQRVQQRLKAWGDGRLDPAQPAHRLCLQAMANSRLASLFLARFMSHGLVADAEYRLWVTSLLGVARWKLPLLDLPLAQEIERRIAQGERRQRVEQALLGCAVEDLNALHLQDLGFADAAALASRLRLSPRLIGNAARRARDNDVPDTLPAELARPLREPHVVCALAYALALEAQLDWHSPRLLHLVRATATCLNRPLTKVIQDMHRAALQASGERLYTRGLLAPAARLIRIGQPRHALRADPVVEAPRASKAQTAPASAPAQVAAVARPAPQPAAGSDYLSRCRTGGFATLAEFLAATAGLLASRGMPRCALFLRMKQPERWANYVSYGFGDAAAVRRISFAPTQLGLLARLLGDAHGALCIQPQQLMAARGKLPAALSGWPPAGGFALATVQVNEAPMGFWWADAGDSGQLMDNPKYAAVRAMASVFGAEFTRLIKAQRAQRQAAAPTAEGS